MSLWMSWVEDQTPLLSLLLPCSHNSATFTTKDFIGPIFKFTSCQDLNIKQQLESGVRVLDLRLAGHFTEKTDSFDYWCAHTFLTVKLCHVLNDCVTFLLEHPSETIIVQLKPDFSSVNSSKLGLSALTASGKSSIVKPSADQIYDYLIENSRENMPTYTDPLTKSTPIEYVRGKIVFYIESQQFVIHR